MNNTKEQQKPQVKVREPKKKTQGIFDNLRPLPHPVEEILGLLPVRSESSAKTESSLTAQPEHAFTPQTKIDENRIDITPVVTPPSTPVITLVDNLPAADEKQPQPHYLDATHSGSEARVYSVMYRETISKGIRERHFGPAELIKKTGIRSDKTIRVALHGLVTKLSLQRLSNVNGNPLGPRYRVFDPKEIVRRRKAAGMEIDTQSKKIITTVATPVTTTVDGGGENYPGTREKTTPVTPVISTGVFKYINNYSQESGDTALSSSKSIANDDDGAFLTSIREVYERATGNKWTTADSMTAQRGRDIAPEVWGVAICYCVDRAPGHKFERLAYVLDQAREHVVEMAAYSLEDILVILKHSLRAIERARASGKWSPEESREVK